MNQSRILIIDDDDLLSEMLKLTLELEGYEVHIAPHGLAGLEQLRAEPVRSDYPRPGDADNGWGQVPARAE